MYTIKFASKRKLRAHGELADWFTLSFVTDDFAEAQAKTDDLNNQSDYYTYEVKELES